MDDLVEERDKIKESFWTSRLKQQYTTCYRLATPLPRLGLIVDLEGIQLFLRGLADGRFGLLADRGRRPVILPVGFMKL